MAHSLLSPRPPFRFKPTALMLCIAASLNISTPSLAQEGPASTNASVNAEIRTYSIPAQPLPEALILFGQQSGLQVTANTTSVGGKRASAVNGSMTAQQALNQLLEGTGMTYRINGAMISLQEMTDASSITLPPVTVSAGILAGTTEGTGSYTTDSATTTTRLALSPRETPQTVAVVTRQQMDDFGMTSVEDVLESTSGVSVYSRGTNGPAYYSRGFELETQYDGMPNPLGIGGGSRSPSTDSAFFDHLEVLQGASGLLNGSGQPGGTINLLRKSPTRDFQAHTEAQLGSWDKRRLVGDVSGPLTTSKAVRGRIVALWDDSESFVDYVYDERSGFYAIVDADLSETTTVSASIQYQNNDGRLYNGVPMAPDGSDIGLSRSTYFGSIHSRFQKEYTLYTLSLEQKLPSDWFLKASYHHGKTESDIDYNHYLWPNTPLNVETGDGFSIYQTPKFLTNASSDTVDIYASGPVQILGRQHEIVFGGSVIEYQDDFYNSYPGGFGTPFNIYDFDPAKLPTVPPVSRAPLTTAIEESQQGFYGVARLNLHDSLKLILGSRVSWYEYRNEGVRTQDENAKVAPYAGVVFDLNEQISAYASYSEIFQPQSQRDRNGNTIDPVIGANYETGVKGEFYDGRLNASAAVFRLEQTNLPIVDDTFGNSPTNPCGGWCYIAQDEIISQGVDLSLSGEILTGWNLSIGYTYVDSEYHSGVNKGNPYRTELPNQRFRVYSSYSIPGSNWTFGGNLNVQSKFNRAVTRSGIVSRFEQEGVATVGLMAKYRINEKAEIGLVADNIFDRKYYASAYDPYYTPYASPRNFLASLKYHF